MSKRVTKNHPMYSAYLSKPQKMLPSRATRRPRQQSSPVRRIDPADYNRSKRGQKLYDQMQHKARPYAEIAPMPRDMARRVARMNPKMA